MKFKNIENEIKNDKDLYLYISTANTLESSNTINTTEFIKKIAKRLKIPILDDFI